MSHFSLKNKYNYIRKRVVYGFNALNKHIYREKVKFSYTELSACFLILLAASVRLILILHDWPATNSDEATVGLMASHISQGKDFPIFLYGQASLGSLEAYVGAGLFLLFGSHIIMLRIGVLLLFVVFLIWVYLLTRLLYTTSLALSTLFLFSFGTVEIFLRSIPATAGHAETPFFATLIMLLSTYIGLISIKRYDNLPTFQRRRCLILYALWGCAIGAAFWNDALAGPFILAAGVFLLICCRSTLRPATITTSLLGCCVGSLPMILHDLSAPPGQRSLDVVRFMTVADPAASAMPLLQRFLAGFLVSLPASTGASGVCRIPVNAAWPLTAQSSPFVLQCTAVHGIWATLFVAVWLLAIALEVRNLSQLKKKVRTQPGEAFDETAQEMVIHRARLMLLSAAGLTWLIFASSVQVASGPAEHSRYLIGLTVATPAMLWPLWNKITSGLSKRNWLSAKIGQQILYSMMLFGYSATLVKGTVECFQEIPGAQAYTRQQYALAANLIHLHVKHIYTDYWTCDLVSFLTREQVICSVVDNQLQAGFNRYPPYVSPVEKDTQASYLFKTAAPQLPILTAYIAQDKRKYQVTSFDGYILYQPTG